MVATRSKRPPAATAPAAKRPAPTLIDCPGPQWSVALKPARDERLGLDAVLVVEGKRIEAHKPVLASYSPYLKALFFGRLAESESNEVTLHDIDPAAVAAIVDCFYTGQVAISAHNVCRVIRTANILRVPAVEAAACNFFAERLEVATVLPALEDFVTDFAAAGGEQGRELERSCLSFVETHFGECSAEDAFVDLTADLLARIVGSDDLEAGEEAVLSAVRRWWEADRGKRTMALVDLLPLVRFPWLPKAVQLQLHQDKMLGAAAQLSSEAAELCMGLLIECRGAYRTSAAAAANPRLKVRKRMPPVPVVFTKAGTGIDISGEAGAVVKRAADTRSADFHGALCNHGAPMSCGRSYAEFEILGDDEDDGYRDLIVGVARPNCNVEKDLVDYGRFWGVYMDTGNMFGPGDSNSGRSWEGKKSFKIGSVVGLLLDSDKGTLTVYKNGTKLGVAVTEGLRGELCWAVSVEKGSARVTAKTLPTD
eukprot:SAG25_NODE_1117_length_3903_cov_24.641316_2_plen_481_part_00